MLAMMLGILCASDHMRSKSRGSLSELLSREPWLVVATQLTQAKKI
jgi:hypothetical protein